MTDLLDFLEIAHEAADLAHDLIRRMPAGRVTPKGDRDMASEVDFAVERALRQMLRNRTPDIAFWGEEEGPSQHSAEYTWVLDPVDGTVNFLHGHPLVATSLGLLHEQTPVLGVIDLPFLHERYAAAQSHGATGPQGPISVSSTARLDQAVVSLGDYAVGQDAVRKNELRVALTAKLAATVQRVRMHGSAAIDLAWLAAGRTDAAVILANNPWDMTAGVALAREAGALVLDRDGSQYTLASATTIALPLALRDSLLGLLRD